MDFKERTRNLEEYIASLTDEERELHKNIIEECRVRNEDIIQCTQRSLSAIKNLEKMEIKILEGLHNLESASQELRKLTAEVYLKMVNKGNIRYS